MSYANEVRTKVAYAAAASGALLLVVGFFFDSAWSAFTLVLGGLLLFRGLVMCASLTLINGVPRVVRFLSRNATSNWNGEFIRTDGSEFLVRYQLDGKGNPWFIASDVCGAIGEKTPKKDEFRRGDIPLLAHGGFLCFSENGVQTYLRTLAIQNHAASRLLLNIQNNVLRQLNNQRSQNRVT